MPKRIERVTFSELDEQRWSVVSFERAEVSYLTYSQAVTAMAKLETRRVSGLCIVTDDAASRIKA